MCTEDTARYLARCQDLVPWNVSTAFRTALLVLIPACHIPRIISVITSKSRASLSLLSLLLSTVFSSLYLGLMFVDSGFDDALECAGLSGAYCAQERPVLLSGWTAWGALIGITQIAALLVVYLDCIAPLPCRIEQSCD